MITVNSISGGKTSAYLAANFKADYNVFSLVRIEDKRAKFKDELIRKQIEDRLQKPFIATAEDDTIIYTILDLEQYLGQKIHWVTGITFDKVIKTKGGWLPNKLHRYCTTHMKLEPIFYWWAEIIGEPVIMNLGFRANEYKRKQKSLERCNENGLITFKASFEKNKRGQNKWVEIEWQKPEFPLIDIKPTYKDEVENYWEIKPVRFAERNNCVGCFHRNPFLLKKQFDKHPEKMNWFMEQERYKNGKNKKATWRSDVSYEQIKNFSTQLQLFDDDFSDCDSGVCGY